nr:nitrilase-related carbon-nitrogen hydrolase [uncultured Cohaesibacter sp.]
MSKHRVAVVQSGTTLFDTPKTLDRMEALCREAGVAGAELMVFPEAYIGGYPKGLDFGARVGTRSDEGRDDYLRYWKSAIEEGGAECDAIGSFARQNKAYIVTGVIERAGGTLYCSVFFFGPDGKYLGKHRKLMPTASERLIWGQGDGSTIPVLDTPLGQLGTAICWENYMPSLRQALYAKGVSIWCAPTVDQREIWQSSMRHVAYEGRTFVLSCCQYMTRADAPEQYDCIQGNDPETVLIRGGSCIISPLGEILAGPVYDREVVLTADIDLDDVIRGKYDLDVSGHYARPDVFHMEVNEAPMSAVSFYGERTMPSEQSPVGSDDDAEV